MKLHIAPYAAEVKQGEVKRGAKGQEKGPKENERK